MESVQQNNSLMPPVLLNTSKALERSSYYGIRALLVVYMIGETLGMDNSQAISVYGWFTTIYIISSLLGAIIGDLLLGNKYTAVAGGVLQALGAFVLCIPSSVTFYLAIGLIFFGSGVYGPNLFSMLGRHFRKRERVLDSGMTVYHTVINVGAFIGAFLISYIGDNSYVIAFLIAGVLMLISSVLVFLTSTPKEKIDDEDVVNKNFSKSVGTVIIAIAVSGLFWLTYEMTANDIYSVSYNIREGSGSLFLRNMWQGINPLIVFLCGVFFALLWFFVKSNRYLKLGVGFLFGAVAYLILLAMPMDYGGLGISIFLASAFLLGVAEILVAPTILAFLVKYTNPKYLAIIFALYLLPLHFLTSIYGMVSTYFYESPNLGLIIGGTVLLLTAVAIIVYSLISKGMSSSE